MFTALIRTHHITSRKKVSVLKAAAKKLNCYVLLRSGAVPGVMYVEGCDSHEVQTWVNTVHDLRYKDYQVCSTVTKAESSIIGSCNAYGTLHELDSVKDFAAEMQKKGLLTWWRNAMGFTST